MSILYHLLSYHLFISLSSHLFSLLFSSEALEALRLRWRRRAARRRSLAAQGVLRLGLTEALRDVRRLSAEAKAEAFEDLRRGEKRRENLKRTL